MSRQVKPPVKRAGKLRSVAQVLDPPYEAHQMRLAGAPWPEVAKATGYRSVAEARAAVELYLQKGALAQSAEQQRNAFQLQLQRYEAVLQSWWEPATKGKDEKAAAVVLRTLAQLDRLQRFGEAEVEAGVRTVVIAGTPEQYVAQLKAVVEGTDETDQ